MVTVFTPAYNRADYLSRVFDSLCNKTCKYFEWLIVDDGSIVCLYLIHLISKNKTLDILFFGGQYNK